MVGSDKESIKSREQDSTKHQEEMLKRLSSIEEDKVKMEIRLSKFEKDKNNESYSFKEEYCHNEVEMSYEMSEILEENAFGKFNVESEIEDSCEENEIKEVKESEPEDYYEKSEPEDSYKDSEPENSYEDSEPEIDCEESESDDSYKESQPRYRYEDCGIVTRNYRYDTSMDNDSFLEENNETTSVRVDEVGVQEDTETQVINGTGIQEDKTKDEISPGTGPVSKKACMKRRLKNRLCSVLRNQCSKVARCCAVLTKK